MKDSKSFKSLIIAWLDGSLTKTEQDQLLLWLEKSPENASYFARVKDIWQASLQNVSKIAETDREWERFKLTVENRIKDKKQKQQRIIGWISGMVAVLVMGFISGFLFVKMNYQHQPVYITATAPAGSVANLLLADSTVVYLNAGSQLTYSSENKSHNREVVLNGEAWFDVVKNDKSPFIVHTQACDIQVEGTRFNVKAYNEDNEVVATLEEGEILLSSITGFKLTNDIRLQPGEQAVVNLESRKAVVQKVETRYYTSWKNNQLMFINMNMKELIIIIERKFGVNIEITDPTILVYHYTGTLKNESVIEVMELIKHTLPVDYKIDGQVIRITKTKKKGVRDMT